MGGSLPLATVNALMTTVEQLDTDATSAEEATVHVALLAAWTGVGGSASTAGETRAAIKRCAQIDCSILDSGGGWNCERKMGELQTTPLIW